MAQTPERTGNSQGWGMQMKKAALATFLYYLFSQGSNVKLMTLFGAIAIFVPPPFGLAAATVIVGSIGGAMAAQRSLTRAFRDVRGYAQPGDFEILGEFNRIQRETPRLSVPMPRPEKTVFPRLEIR